MNKRQRLPSQKATRALEFMSKGLSKRQSMLKAGYSKFTAANPKKNLLEQPNILSALERMKITLENRGVTDIFLAEQLAKFAQTGNAKDFFQAYDRIEKIIGIQPNKEILQKKREFTFTEWATQDQPPPTPETHKDENLDDLISLDSIKLDRFDNPVAQDTLKEETSPLNSHFEPSSHDLQETIY